MLASGEATGFRMNVDGRKGSSFNNVGYRQIDSMYVFVEVPSSEWWQSTSVDTGILLFTV